MSADAAAVISRAIREHKLIQFRYFGEPQAAEPHQLGTDSDRDLVLLGWHCGSTHGAQGIAGWQRYAVKLMHDVRMLDWQFYNPRPTFVPGPSRHIPHVKCELKMFQGSTEDIEESN